jgi:hypothetical protein
LYPLFLWLKNISNATQVYAIDVSGAYSQKKMQQ